MLNTRRRFAAAAFAPILNDVVVIAMFLSLPRLVDGPITLETVVNDPQLVLYIGLGTTAGIATMALALWPALRHAGVRLKPAFAWRHTAVRTMVRLSGWTIGYVIANQIALWVVLVLANGKSAGAFVYLGAYAFFQLPHGLFAVSITTASQPDLAGAFVAKNWLGFRYRFARGMRLILTLMIPAAALYIGLAQPIVAALLQRGAFDASDTERVADTLRMFAIGLPAFSLYLYSLRALLHARHPHTVLAQLLGERTQHRRRAHPLPHSRTARSRPRVRRGVHDRDTRHHDGHESSPRRLRAAARSVPLHSAWASSASRWAPSPG